jgi:hypothetical protein
MLITAYADALTAQEQAELRQAIRHLDRALRAPAPPVRRTVMVSGAGLRWADT